MKFSLLGLFFFLVLDAQAQVRLTATSQVTSPATAQPAVPMSRTYPSRVDAGGYVYVSGQGAERPDGSMSSKFEEQVRQALDNVKMVVETAGLTMNHVVYMQVYLEDISNYQKLNRVSAQYFSETPPARAVLGVARVPQRGIEINAVAVRNLAGKRAVVPPRYRSTEPVSPGILTYDRLFVSGMLGRDPATGRVPDEPALQVDLALDGLEAVVEAAGLKLGHMVFVNPYLTNQIPGQVMNQHYAKRFEFGNTPARATIEVSSLPDGAHVEYTGVAVRDLSQRRAVRPRNMSPSPTASPCVFAGDTLYCSAKDGFTPGPNSGIYGATPSQQLRQTMRNLLDNLEEADMDFRQVVATTVYLDDLSDTDAINRVYSEYFKGILPAQTTLQQIPSVERKPDAEESYPGLEQISLIAIRPKSNP